jgi:tRNA-dihydrouridine synthase
VDILPENNLVPIVPQLMCCSVEDFFMLHDYIVSLGYNEVNWNMGCPYPMVTNKGLGAGVLNKPEVLRNWLEAISPKLKLKLGIKMRMGMSNTEEIHTLIPILNDYDLTEVIIHARYAEQLYNGGCDIDQFKLAAGSIKHPVTYNGDITDLDSFHELSSELNAMDRFMIGRGAISNPAIFQEIKTGILLDPVTYRSKLLTFSRHIEESCMKVNDNEGYALMRLKSYWEAFSEELTEGKAVYRKLKKATNLNEFWDLLNRGIVY